VRTCRGSLAVLLLALLPFVASSRELGPPALTDKWKEKKIRK